MRGKFKYWYYQSITLACRRTSGRPFNFHFLPSRTSLSRNYILICFAMPPPGGRTAALQPGSQHRGIARPEIGYQ